MTEALRKFFYILLLFTFSCYPEGNPEEKPEQVDNPGLREKTGGTPEESSVSGLSPFFAPPTCRQGFGLCELEMQQPQEANTASSLTYYNATFYLSTVENQDILRIEFDQPIPHFGPDFEVSGTDTLKNVFGYSYILPVAGKYKTAEKSSEFPNGSVEVKVAKGSPNSTYK